jgi:methionyl aminopeptidase
MYTQIKTLSEIASMESAGKICSEVLKIVAQAAEPGMSTKDLANIAADEIRKKGGQPSFYGYNGFPDVICISVNDEVVHGIPKVDKIIKSGDIVSLDLGVTYERMIVDSAISILVGEKDTEKQKLLNETKNSLAAGISQLKDGCRVGDIGSAVQAVLDQAGYGIVRDLVGHGVGHAVHEDPNIPNYGEANSGPKLKAGMTIAIEPMSTTGGHEVHVAEDKWTIKTNDQSLSAHFEQTVLITEKGFKILTPY